MKKVAAKVQEVKVEKEVKVRYVISKEDITNLGDLLDAEVNGAKFGIVDHQKAYRTLVAFLQQAVKQEEIK